MNDSYDISKSHLGLRVRWLTADGIVYSAGDNDSGQLGRSGKRTKPFKIESIEHLPVESVAAGNGFTATQRENMALGIWASFCISFYMFFFFLTAV